MTTNPELRTIRYVDGVEEVLVAVPWDYQTGMIPPPALTFGGRQFIYSGDGPNVAPK